MSASRARILLGGLAVRLAAGATSGEAGSTPQAKEGAASAKGKGKASAKKRPVVRLTEVTSELTPADTFKDDVRKRAQEGEVKKGRGARQREKRRARALGWHTSRGLTFKPFGCPKALKAASAERSEAGALRTLSLRLPKPSVSWVATAVARGTGRISFTRKAPVQDGFLGCRGRGWRPMFAGGLNGHRAQLGLKTSEG